MLATAEKDLRLCTIISDQIALGVSIGLALVLRLYLPVFTHTEAPQLEHGTYLLRYLALGVLWYSCMSGTGNYVVSLSSRGRVWNAIKGTALFTAIVLAVAFFRWTLFSRAAVLLFVILGTVVTVSLRYLIPYVLMRLLGHRDTICMLLIGDGEWASHVAALLQENFGCSVTHRPRLTLAGVEATPDTDRAGLELLLRELRPDEVILAQQGGTLDEIRGLLNLCNQYRVPWHFVPTLEQLVFTNVRTQLLGGVPVIGVKSCSLSVFDLLIKRVIDVSVASLMLLFAAPVMAVVWIAVRLTSPGPAIFVQKRIGHKGRVFDFYKFRTMYVDREENVHQEYVKQWIANQAHSGTEQKATFKIVGDKRITRVGKVLRRYSLDELPQIVNVLKGDMSLVGPRPALLYEIELYKEWHKERLEGIPGLTGLWQVAGRNNISFDDMVKLDLEYLRNWKPSEDLKVLLKTVPVVLSGSGH